MKLKSFNKKTAALVLAAAALALGSSQSVLAKNQDRMTGRGTGPVVFVTSLGLYFDSIVLTDLPNIGPFQQLIPTERGLETEFGPGTPGHRGGRWWIDTNMDGIQDDGDMFFLCPLLGPGRAEL